MAFLSIIVLILFLSQDIYTPKESSGGFMRDYNNSELIIDTSAGSSNSYSGFAVKTASVSKIDFYLQTDVLTFLILKRLPF